MAYEVSQLTVDLLNDRATVVVNQNVNGKTYNVHINVPIETPGNQPEHRLQQIAKAAAKQALLDAANAL
jgi:hypothetical protein